jgi:hypothetical protein
VLAQKLASGVNTL